MRNRVIYFVKRPVGLVDKETFDVRQESLGPSPDDTTVLVESVYASVDPYMRGRLSDRRSYTAPFEVGQPMIGAMVGRVVDGQGSGIPAGTWVSGAWAWAEYAWVPPTSLMTIPDGVPPTTALHVLGVTGLTAYFGITAIGHPHAGETCVVSAAAGAVGSIAVQIGKIMGLQLVGIAGSDEKCRWVENALGADAVVNYRSETFRQDLKAAVANGVDIYFDNVGGEVTDGVMGQLNRGARIIICGQISQYNAETTKVVERPRFADLLISRASATGFIVSDFRDQFPSALAQLQTWYQAGQLHAEETIADGFDRWVDAFLGLFRGDNRGKQIVKLR